MHVVHTLKHWFLDTFNDINKLKKIFNAEVKIKLNGKEKGSIIIPFNNIEEYEKLNKILNSD